MKRLMPAYFDIPAVLDRIDGLFAQNLLEQSGTDHNCRKAESENRAATPLGRSAKGRQCDRGKARVAQAYCRARSAEASRARSLSRCARV